MNFAGFPTKITTTKKTNGCCRPPEGDRERAAYFHLRNARADEKVQLNSFIFSPVPALEHLQGHKHLQHVARSLAASQQAADNNRPPKPAAASTSGQSDAGL